MPEEDKHLQLMRQIVKDQARMEGEEMALGMARSAPLQINPEGEITEYYGTGKNALDLLTQQYEEVWGKNVADRKIQAVINKKFPEDRYEEIPERIRPQKQTERSDNLIKKIKDFIS